jgi:hypothetical protein
VGVSDYYQNPGNASFRDFPPGPHSGVDPDEDHHVAPDSMDGRARTALTLGLLSFLLSVLTGIPAIWVGVKALTRISASDGELEGSWAAWTGIALGCLSVVVLCAVWLYLHSHS